MPGQRIDRHRDRNGITPGPSDQPPDVSAHKPRGVKTRCSHAGCKRQGKVRVSPITDDVYWLCREHMLKVDAGMMGGAR